jgi:hypothetical protein
MTTRLLLFALSAAVANTKDEFDRVAEAAFERAAEEDPFDRMVAKSLSD